MARMNRHRGARGEMLLYSDATISLRNSRGATKLEMPLDEAEAFRDAA